MFLKISKYNCFWVSPGLINSLFGARSDTSRQVDGPPATECHTARGGGWYRWDRHSCWRTDAPPQFCSKYFPCAKYFKWVSFISTSRCMSPSHLCLNQMSSVIAYLHILSLISTFLINFTEPENLNVLGPLTLESYVRRWP